MSKGNIYTRKFTVNSIKSTSAYAIVNAKHIEERNQRIGVSVSAVREIMQQVKLTNKVMPNILGISPQDSKWHEIHKAYWNSLTVIVPTTGLRLDTSLMFNKEQTRTEYENKIINVIKEYSYKVKANPNNEGIYYKDREQKLLDVEDSYLDHITIINPKDYMIWRYILNYRDVANRQVDSKLSKHIRFYIYDKEEETRLNKVKFQMATKANELYLKNLANKEWIDAVLRILTRNNSKINVNTMTALEKQMELYKIVNNNPSKFVAVTKDTNLTIKALIEKYISKGVITRKPNSSLLIEPTNNDIIGNNIDDAVTFFKNEEQNKLILRAMAERYKSLPNN